MYNAMVGNYETINCFTQNTLNYSPFQNSLMFTSKINSKTDHVGMNNDRKYSLAISVFILIMEI